MRRGRKIEKRKADTARWREEMGELGSGAAHLQQKGKRKKASAARRERTCGAKHEECEEELDKKTKQRSTKVALDWLIRITNRSRWINQRKGSHRSQGERRYKGFSFSETGELSRGKFFRGFRGALSENIRGRRILEEESSGKGF